MQITQCPEPGCESPSEVIDRFPLPSTEGYVEMIRLVCLYRHWFIMPVSSMRPEAAPAPGAISMNDWRRRRSQWPAN